MREADLRAINNIPPRMLIKAGSTLLVPRSAKMDDDVTSHVADTGQMTLAPEIVTRRSTVKARKGETVASIAKRFSVTAANVADWNDVKDNAKFKTGSQVVVFLPVKAQSTTSRSTHSKRTVSKRKRR
jgi:membrane-bound lytic murein transglycosylase D